ncbi:hypothetical protein MRX96_012999 [Rhipicephalus microplus]
MGGNLHVALLAAQATPLLSLGSSIITSPRLSSRAGGVGPAQNSGLYRNPKTFLPLARHHNGATPRSRGHAICGLFMIALGPAVAVLSCQRAPLLVFISGESPLAGFGALITFLLLFFLFARFDAASKPPTLLLRSVASSPFLVEI